MWSIKRTDKPAGPDKNRPAEEPPRSEEFLQLPRVEFLLNQMENPARDLAAHITNKLESIERFSLEVPDDSMADAGLCRGDLAIIDAKQKPENDDVVAVTLGDRMLIRRYASSHNRIRLESTSDPDRILIVDPATPGFTLLGKVIQVIREIG
ncbi:MAG: S24 family peptidase [Calditrichota bacterium]